MRALSWWIGGAVCGLLAMAAPAPAGGASPAGESQVLRFKSAVKGRIGGQDHLIVVADAPHGGRSVRLVVPNQDAGGKYDPDRAEADLVKGLRTGELIQASWDAEKDVSTLTSLSRYSPRPGELAAGGYIFVRSEQPKAEPVKGAAPKGVPPKTGVAKDDAARGASAKGDAGKGDAAKDPGKLTIVLSKLGETTQAVAPCQPDADGELHCDRLLESVLAGLKEGDVVWADLSAGSAPTVLALMPYVAPQRGKLLKTETADVEGQKGLAVHIDVAGTITTATIAGKLVDNKWVSDTRLLGAARRCKPGAIVLFRVQQDRADTWLREIEPEPAPPVARRTPNHGNGSNTDANGLPHPRIPGGGTPGVGGVGF